MHIRYHTGMATVIQFMIGTLLTFITGANAVASCYALGNTDCVSNTFVSLLLVLLVIGGYGVLAGVGFLAQAQRSRRLALVLIGLEACAGIIFLFDAKQSPDLVDRLANLVAFAVVIWVSYIAFTLFRSGGARIVRARRTK